jgi:hypothetical protein
LQHSAFRFPGLFQPLMDLGMLPLRFYESRLNGRYLPKDYAKHTPFRVDYPLGAAMMGRGAAIKEVGALDEAFFMYCEEIERRGAWRKMGWQTCSPAASGGHPPWWREFQSGATSDPGPSLEKPRSTLSQTSPGSTESASWRHGRRHFRRALSKHEP